MEKSEPVSAAGAGAAGGARRPEPAKRRRRARLCALVAAILYLGFAVWLLRAVLADPTQLLAFPVRVDGRPEAPIGVLDQVMVVAVTTRNARVLATEPWSILGGQLCYPTPNAHTLGEHMLGLGLLAAPAYAVTGDPLASYNAALVLTLWIPALAMYALVAHFTASAPAAFLAGLLFGFFPVRVGDLAHPFTHGDLWTPLVLLFWHRLVARGRWRDSLGFAASLGLQLLESFYSVLECAALLLPFGAWAAWRHRARLRDRWPQIALAAALVLAVVALVLGPYLDTRATWSVLAKRGGWLNFPGAFGFGGLFYPGTVAAVLAAVALLDRLLRGPWRGRDGDDPRWAMLAAGIFALWVSLVPLEVPGLGVRLPAPLVLARGILPGLDSIRVPGLIGHGFTLACAVLAGYGVLALRRGGARAMVAIAAIASLLVLVERLHAPLASATYRRTMEIETMRLRPDDAAIELVRGLRGPTVDLPTPIGRKLGAIRGVTEHLLLAAYHGQPSSSCYNSFRGPVTTQVWELAGRLPDARAVEALAALGFASALALDRHHKPARRQALDAAAADDGGLASDRALALRGRAAGVGAYDLVPRAPVRAGDWSLLAPDAAPAAGAPGAGAVPVTVAAGATATIGFAIANRGDATFLHPEPIAPTALVVRWLAGSDGGAAATVESRALLPLALASGDALTVLVPSRVPEAAGEYEVVLARAAAPGVEIGRTRARVEPVAPVPEAPEAAAARR